MSLILIYAAGCPGIEDRLHHHQLLRELLARDIPARLHLAGEFTRTIRACLYFKSDGTTFDPKNIPWLAKYSESPDLLVSADVGVGSVLKARTVLM